MTRIYTVVLEERTETCALVSATNIREAHSKASRGDYDILPETSMSLPTRIKRVILSDLIPKTRYPS